MTPGCLSEERLEELLTGHLSAREVVRLRGHLAGCALCRRRGEEMEEFLAPLREALRMVESGGPGR